MALVGAQSNRPRLPPIPQGLPKTQAEWQAIVNALQQWRASLTSPKWIVPTLQNGWLNYGENYGSIGYMLDVDGRVRLRGLLSGASVTGGLPSTLFTLPAPYAPIAAKALGALAGTSSSTTVIVEVDALSTGAIVLQSNAGSVPRWISLDGLSFDTQP